MRLYILLFLFIFCSCGTRKKVLDVTNTKSEVLTQKEYQKNVQKDIKEVVISDIAISEVKSDVNTTFEGKVSDSTKPASIEESVKDGIKTTVFNNFKSVRTTDSKGRTNKQTKENKELTLIDKSNESLQKKEEEDKKDESKTKSLDLERKSSNSWIFWLILALGVVGGAYYAYTKKVNPLNWF
jgi:hypothetical protein